MKVIGLDGKEYSWNFTKHNEARADCSMLHSRVRILLRAIFPYDCIYEEVALPGIKTEIVKRVLMADFYIHAPRLMIEVQGEQHDKFVEFFHHNRSEFFRARKLDSLKRQWCHQNEITLVELAHDGTDAQWEQQIRNIK